jgi:hypothetical protein
MTPDVWATRVRVVADRLASFVAPELRPTTVPLTSLLTLDWASCPRSPATVVGGSTGSAASSTATLPPSSPSPHSSVPSPPPSPPFLQIYGLAVTYEGERMVLESGLKEED